ncbi:MAG: hypothetical protein ACI4ON_06135 [Clostridia bacterium]
MLGGIDAYNKFFYAGETLDKESKKINAKKDECEIDIRSIEERKKVEAELKQKEQKKSFFRPAPQDVLEDEIEEGYTRFFNEDDESLDCVLLDISNLLNEKFQKYEKAPKGQDLLKRDLNTSKLYIFDDGDLMQVKSICEVKPELPEEDEVYLLFDTNREYYVVSFACVRSF